MRESSDEDSKKIMDGGGGAVNGEGGLVKGQVQDFSKKANLVSFDKFVLKIKKVESSGKSLGNVIQEKKSSNNDSSKGTFLTESSGTKVGGSLSGSESTCATASKRHATIIKKTRVLFKMGCDFVGPMENYKPNKKYGQVRGSSLLPISYSLGSDPIQNSECSSFFHGELSTEFDIIRCNNKLVKALRHGGGEFLWKAIVNLGVKFSEPVTIFRKKISELENSTKALTEGGKVISDYLK